MPTSTSATAIFIHGAGGGGWEWIVWQRVFAARGWATHAPDLIPAKQGIAATRFEDYAEQVSKSCRDAQRPLVLVGASLGGLLALIANARAAAAALLLVNPLPPAGIEPRPAPRDLADVVPWGRDRSLARTRCAMPDADDAACLFAFRRWRDESGAVLRAAANDVVGQAPACPVLLLASELDDDVPPAASRALAASIGAEFRLIASASHVGPLLGRNASAIAEESRAWCDRVVRSRYIVRG
jgi:pimeloyl-ACP methyl ester carboxylesterase